MQMAPHQKAKRAVSKHTPDDSEDDTFTHPTEGYTDLRSMATAMVDIAFATENGDKTNPERTAAAALYAARIMMNRRKPQQEIADSLGVSVNAIRSEYENMINAVYGVEVQTDTMAQTNDWD